MMQFVKIQIKGNGVVDYACNPEGRGIFKWEDDSLYTEVAGYEIGNTPLFKSKERFLYYLKHFLNVSGKVVEASGWT